MEGAVKVSCTCAVVIAAVVLLTGGADEYLQPGQCGMYRNGKYVCFANDSGNLSVPCGNFTLQPGVSFSYYTLENRTVLAVGVADYLHVNVSRNDTGVHVCCRPNISTGILEDACYELVVTYPPTEVSLDWPAGYSKWPVYGEPFALTCPLEGNPPAVYWWERYTDIPMREQVSLPSDLVFSGDGRSWSVQSFETRHQGMYVCSASNFMGVEKYVNMALFFLSAERCSSFEAEDAIVNIIAPSGLLEHSPGQDLTLNCTAVQVGYLTGKPYWWVEINGTLEFCEAAHYVQQAYYDESTCTWISSLNIQDFSATLTGNYFCGFGNHLHNQTVDIKEPELADTLSDSSLKNSDRTYIFRYAILGIVTILAVLGFWGNSGGLQHREPPVTGFKYDIFISSHDEARQFAEDRVLLPLESGCNPPYKVCWHHRDFIVGIPIVEQIANTIQQSRKVVFIFSEHFMNSRFCCLELEQALHRLTVTRTRCVIPIALCEDSIPEELKHRITYWPIVGVEEEDFLEKITTLIGEPIQLPHSQKSSGE